MAQDLVDEKYVEFKYRSVPENAHTSTLSSASSS